MRLSLVFALVVVAFVAMQGRAAAQTERTFVFGISLALNPPPTQSFKYLQTETLKGLQIWKDWWNGLDEDKRLMKDGTPFKVELHIAEVSNFTNTAENEQLLQLAYANMIANSSIDFLFMPVGTPWDIPLRNYTYYEHAQEFMVAFADSSEAYYAVPGSYGSVTANILSMTSYLPYLRVAKAVTVAAIFDDEIYQEELCRGVLDQADLNSLTVTLQARMDFDYNTYSSLYAGVYGVINQTRAQMWRDELDKVIALDVDALFICDYGPGSEFAIEYLREKDWVPKSLTVTLMSTTWARQSNKDFLTGITGYDKSARFPSQANFGDVSHFNALCEAKDGESGTTNSARAALGGMIFTYAIQNAKDNSSDAVNTALATGQLKSFMGTSAFDTSSRQTLSSLAVQYLNNGSTVNVIGPALAAAEALIYPMPTWKERIFDPKWGHGTEIAAAVLMALGAVATIGWVVFLIVHWNHRVIVAASPLFLLAIILGSFVVYISIFSWMPNLINDSVCNLRAWLLPLGFMTMFGALLAKTHRIHRLYNSKGINIIVIRNVQVALITLLIVVGQAVISVLMITVTKLNSSVHIVDQYRVSYNYRVCSFSTALKILLGINIGYAFLLLIWGSYLAYRIRKVPISIYDESKVIAFSIYNTCFFGIIVIVVQLAISNSNRYLTFMITAVCCFLGALITTSCLFGAKLWAIYKPNRDLKSSGTMGTSSSGDSRSKPGSIQGSVASRDENHKNAKKYKKKYKGLKNLNKDLKERIRQLEGLARSHGFLADQDVEMQESTPPPKPEKPEKPEKEKKSAGTSAAAAHDKFTPKPPMNASDSDSDSDDE